MHDAGTGDEPVEFGPGTARRLAWAVVALLLAGGVVAYAMLAPKALLVPLVSAAPLVPLAVAGILGRVRPPTVVDRDGIRCHTAFSYQVRRQFVPWTAIARIDVQKRGRRTFAVLQLTDGARMILRHPAGPHLREAVASMQQRHLAACGGRLPAVDRVPLPWRRLRAWVLVAAIALPVVSVIGLVTWMSAAIGSTRSPDDVAACDQIPREAVARVLPDGGVHGFGNRAACRWSTGSTSENGTWIDFHIVARPPSEAERSYRESLKAMRSAGRAPHLLRDADAYTVAWQDAWGFTAQGRANVKGYQVMVALHSRKAASADEAERQVGDVLRAVTEKLA
ncbi:PH domain-containing protein [Actinomadura chokoriensis]|uniref:PH domain-containing protein n=1 Tax=Actinomadura chokoriensis TaxID=454156 RepID=UPI0031F865F7